MSWTRTGKLVAVATFFLFVIAVMNESAPVYVLGSAGLFLLIACWLLSRSTLHGLSCAVELAQTTAIAGGRISLVWRLRNDSTGTRGPVVIAARAENKTVAIGATEQQRLILVIRPEEQLICRLDFTCPARGRYSLSDIHLQIEDPLGLFRRNLAVAGPPDALALPPADHLGNHRTGRRLLSRGGRRRSTRAGEGADFHGVREYVPGDDLRRVHWKTTARTGELAVREFEQTWSGTVAILLDLSQAAVRGRGAEATTETGIRAAASLARTAQMSGGAFMFATRGDRRLALPVERGEAHLHRLLVGLADIRAEGPLSLGQLLRAEAQTIGAGSVLFLITPATDRTLADDIAGVASRVAQVIVVAVTEPEPEEQQLRAETAFTRAVRSAGAIVVPAPRGGALESLPLLGGDWLSRARRVGTAVTTGGAV